MNRPDVQVLLVTQDADLVVTLGHVLMTGLTANLTVSDNVEQATVLAASNGFDVIIACQRLDDGTGLSMLAEQAGDDTSPVILLDDELDAQRVLTALRLGAADVFSRPLDTTRLVEAVRRAAERRRRKRQLTARAERLRRVSSRLVRDRKDLRDRVDLICRDLVQAYHRLAEKVVAGRGEPGSNRQSVGTTDAC
jgi:DNA-binding NtrC family response regulator